MNLYEGIRSGLMKATLTLANGEIVTVNEDTPVILGSDDHLEITWQLPIWD